MNRDTLVHFPKRDLITLVLTQAAENAVLTKRVAALEAKLGEPPKTPDNSSLPPSRGQKPNFKVNIYVAGPCHLLSMARTTTLREGVSSYVAGLRSYCHAVDH